MLRIVKTKLLRQKKRNATERRYVLALDRLREQELKPPVVVPIVVILDLRRDRSRDRCLLILPNNDPASFANYAATGPDSEYSLGFALDRHRRT